MKKRVELLAVAHLGWWPIGAARNGAEVTVIEHMDRVKQNLSTGKRQV